MAWRRSANGDQSWSARPHEIVNRTGPIATHTPPIRPIGGASGPAMASRIDTGNPRRPDPRLYLISPEVEHPAAFADTLAAALARAEVAAVLLRLALHDERS